MEREGDRNRRVLTISLLAAALAATAAIFGLWIVDGDPEARTILPSTPTAVFVYLLPEDALSPGDKAAWVPVERFVGVNSSTENMLRLALEALVEGPTRDEQARGLRSVFSEASAGLLKDVEVEGGHAIVDFRDFRQLIPQASTSNGGIAFSFALNLTVFQFDEIRSVDYSIEGDCSGFWEFLQAGECQPPVTREAWDEAGLEAEP